MSWFRRAPPSPKIEDLRTRQFEELGKVLNVSQQTLPGPASAVRRYHLTVATQYGNLLVCIDTPERFPENAPIFRALNPVTHQWLDDTGLFVRHPDLQGWSVHSSLATICSNITAEFQRSPPLPRATPQPQQAGPPGRQAVLTRQPQPHVTPHPSNPSHLNQASNSPQMVRPQQPPAAPVPAPVPRPSLPIQEIPNEFTELDALTIDELQELTTGEGAIQNFIEKKANRNEHLLRAEKDLIQEVKALAESSLVTRTQLEQLQAENLGLRDTVEAKLQEYRTLHARQQAILQRYSPAALLQLLTSAIDELDEKADAKFAAFKEQDSDSESSESSDSDAGSRKKKSSKMTISSFCKEHIKLRKKAHILQAKKEYLSRQI